VHHVHLVEPPLLGERPVLADAVPDVDLRVRVGRVEIVDREELAGEAVVIVEVDVVDVQDR
jgi:hypothetical protein